MMEKNPFQFGKIHLYLVSNTIWRKIVHVCQIFQNCTNLHQNTKIAPNLLKIGPDMPDQVCYATMDE